MHARCKLIAAAVAALLCIPLSAPAQPQPTAASDPQSSLSALTRCQARTLAIGETSGWGWNVPNFLGAELILRDQAAWWNFWEQHTSLNTPPALQPYVDFNSEVVVAVIQGIQNSGGGPSITITGVSPSSDLSSRSVVIRIVDDERPGPLDVITNPYHVVAVPRACLPPQAAVIFLHVAPTPGTAVIRGTLYVPANATDWRGLPDALVRLHTSNGEFRTTRTGEDGSYFFLDLAPSTYIVDANNPPYFGDPVTIQAAADSVNIWDFYLSVGPTP